MGSSQPTSESWAGVCFERFAGPSHETQMLTSQHSTTDPFVISPLVESEFGSIMATPSDDLAAFMNDCFDDPMSGDVASQVLDEWSLLVDDSTSHDSDLFSFNGLACDKVDAVSQPEPLEPFVLPSPQPAKRSFLSLCVPTLDDAPPLHRTVSPPSTDASSEEKRCYRQSVAIPRYLKKRQHRKWDREIMHISRSEAAFKRPRKTGKFHRTAPVFVPVSQLHA